MAPSHSWLPPSDGRNRIAWTIGLMLLFAAMTAAVVPRSASRDEAPRAREIRLVVRDMTFYAEGRNEANPTLVVRRGERVRLVLANDDAGMRHDVTIPAWKVGTRLIESSARDAAEFTVPDAAGEAVYACTPHRAIMRGTIRIE